ncbi:NAD binding domain of 6-phosphogluconate dehydrogenase-domain-containing protein [Kickxella alabastrina]|uniref:NAD binding domain of 6-phosphogluconate dehydrogenase-domain-containing protein n=1 Tax=Kickxella alabastrina TaxID=61397 RepID=UPI00221FFB2D|nr:NAD binding domain of 6-phosphogluconate dehydrogenase-domain-containing protein [Kickxella alabastrina]KAI7821432.1 NAD binding domain of 6-phosphogluconate dehydrogenase-domain-containing protein [Kickxella alabastrina]
MASNTSTVGLRIGFVGLGTMGQAMALNMQAHRTASGNLSISVYNRTASKAKAVEDQGATVCASPAEVAARSDVVFLSLFDGDAVQKVIAEILNSLTDTTDGVAEHPLVIADTTTVHPSVTKHIIELVAGRQASLRRRVEFSQTPIWGTPPAAVAANLVIVVSGTAAELVEAVAVPAIAHTAINCGPDGVRAAKFKVLGNFMIAAIIESLGEAMAVAEQNEIGRELYLEFIKHVMPIAPVVGYAAKMVDQGGEASKTQVNFTVPGGMKDVGYAIDMAKDVGMRLHVAELAYEHLQWVVDNGDSNWDWSSLAFALRKQGSKEESKKESEM